MNDYTIKQILHISVIVSYDEPTYTVYNIVITYTRSI